MTKKLGAGDSRRAAAFWRELSTIRRSAPILSHALVTLLGLEILIALAAPYGVPDHVYLRWYLGDRARERTGDILEDRDPFLLWDDLAGWTTKPHSGKDKWQVDSYGARTTHPIALERTRPTRVLFLGNSLTNGGMHVTNAETVSACIEDSLIESINGGTMLYAADQMYLSYQRFWKRFRPDVIVVGLSSLPYEGLTSRYIPFRRREEVNIPYFKPRFELRGDSLRLISPPSRDCFRMLLVNSDLVNSLRESDRYYSEFARYKHLGLTPVANAVRSAYQKVSHLMRRLYPGDAESLAILRRIMSSLVAEAAEDGARVVFMILPNQPLAFPGGWRRYLPDHLSDVAATLRADGHVLLDMRGVLSSSGLRADQLYGPDRIHYTPAGNRIIAAALKAALSEAGPRSGGNAR